MTLQRQLVYAGCIGLLACGTCLGVACIPQCDNIMMLMLPGILIAAVAMPQGIHGYNPTLFVVLAGVMNALLYGLIPLAIFQHRSNKLKATLSILLAFIALPALTGCQSKSPAHVALIQDSSHYPARPLIAPPPFKLFHQTDNTLTLVTDENATNDQVEAILWQLRDAAAAHSFDALHLPQAFIDKRDPIVWFHLYRGVKCASEKYTTGKYPCGASYHAAGEFTFGSFKNPNRTDGELLLDENHSTALWNPNEDLKAK